MQQLISSYYDLLKITLAIKISQHQNGQLNVINTCTSLVNLDCISPLWMNLFRVSAVSLALKIGMSVA